VGSKEIMKILMLTPYLPYPTNSGGQIRSYNLIKQLSKKHEITLCSLIKYHSDQKYIKHLESFCKEIYVFKRSEKPFTISNIFRTGFSQYPFLVVRNLSSSEKNKLPEIIEKGKFDLIHAETFYVCPHIPQTNIPIVMVDQTIEFRVYEHYIKNFRYTFLRPLLYIDVLKLRYWESFYWKKVSKVVAVSEQDALAMKKLIPDLSVEVVPNGVGEDLIEDVSLHYNKQILFMGNYAWLQNAEAARILVHKVFPLIRKKIPDVKLIIAGQVTEKIQDLKINDVRIVDLPINDIANVQKYFRTSGVHVAPLYGPGGTRLKILGSMAAKLPVVTTKIGIAGIHAKEGEEVLLGETYADLANRTIELFENRKLYEKIAKNARTFVEKNYFYESIARKLDTIYHEVAKEATT
jgi:polysaccharide biosynthesis protein PslH